VQPITIRSRYDHQAHRFAGSYGDNGFLEDDVASVRGEPIGRVVLVASTFPVRNTYRARF
jgi:hypothetical protein